MLIYQRVNHKNQGVPIQNPHHHGHHASCAFSSASTSQRAAMMSSSGGAGSSGAGSGTGGISRSMRLLVTWLEKYRNVMSEGVDPGKWGMLNHGNHRMFNILTYFDHGECETLLNPAKYESKWIKMDRLDRGKWELQSSATKNWRLSQVKYSRMVV